MFVTCPLFCPVDVGTNPNGKVSTQWRMASYAAKEVNSGIRVQPFMDIKGSGRCLWTSSGHHGWVSITFYIIWGTSQVFPIQYVLFYCCFCSHTSKCVTSSVKSNIQIPSSTELPGVSRPVVSYLLEGIKYSEGILVSKYTKNIYLRSRPLVEMDFTACDSAAIFTYVWWIHSLIFVLMSLQYLYIKYT